MPKVLTGPVGTVLTDAMVISKSAIERTEFHREWVAPQGYYSVLAANVIREGGRVAVALLSRRKQEDDFQGTDLDLLATLTPHLQRAVRTHWRLGSIQRTGNLAIEVLDRLTFGILITDRTFRVIFANRIAEEILAESDGVGLGRLGLYATKAAQTSALRRLIVQAAGLEAAGSVK